MTESLHAASEREEPLVARIFPKLVPHEHFNTFSHLIAGGLSIIGFAALMLKTADGSSPPWGINFFYGISMQLLFFASGIWHSKKQNDQQESIFQKLDELAIFLMIVGTLTPIAYFYLRSPLRWWILGAEWALAAVGVASKFLKFIQDRGLSTGVYLTMGWIPILGLDQFVQTMPLSVFLLILGGGIAYTIGAVFYIRKKPDYFHEIFHVAVVIGAFLHYLAIYNSQ